MKRGTLVIGILVSSLLLAGFVWWIHANRGPFPDSRAAILGFDDRRDALEALYRELNQRGFEKITCIGGNVYVDRVDKVFDATLSSEDQANVFERCVAANIGMAWRIERGYLFYLGPAEKGDYEFNIAYIKVSVPDDSPNCEVTVPSGIAGKCHYALGTGWILDYEWYLKSYLYGELDEAT